MIRLFLILMLIHSTCTAFTWPAEGRITSGFGKRVHPITRKVSMHQGVDIANECGEKVYVASSGTVINRVWDHPTYGNMVSVFHRGSYVTTYAHLGKILVGSNENVHEGQVIGRIGMSGVVTGCHLHFEIIRRGIYINPLGSLEKK